VRNFIPFLIGFLLAPSIAFGILSEGDKSFSPTQNRLLTNPGFEFGTTGWTASGGTFTTTTSTKAAGAKAGSWDSNSAGQTLTSTSVAIPDGLKGRNGVLSCVFKADSGTATHTLTANDGTNDLATAQTITSSTSLFQRTSVNFIFPTSGNIKAKMTSVASDEPKIYFDSCYFDLAEGYNISQVSQATVVASARWAATTSCDWSTTSTSFSNFGADSDCPSPTVEGNASAPSTKIPGLTFATLPEGDYYIVAKGAFLKYNLDQYVWFRFSDGTNATTEQQIYVSGAIYAISPNIVGRLKLTSPQSNVTLQIQAKVQTSVAAHIDVGPVAGSPLEITVYRFPLSSEIAYQASAGGLEAGDIVATAASSCPVGTIAADGSDVSRSGYPRLFSKLGTTYGTGDGSTTFGLPDYRGIFIRGVGTSSKLDYSAGGDVSSSALGTYTNDAFQGHFHSGNGNGSNEFIYNRGGSGVLSALASGTVYDRTTTPGGTASTDGTNGTPRTSSETRPFYTSVTYCIRTVPATPAPVLVGSVTSNSAGAERIERASINDTGTCSIVSQSGSWVSSATVNGTGRCDLVITGFSSRPSCTCTVTNAGTASRTCHINGTPTSTSVSPYTLNAGTASSENFDIICMGPR